jgi:hypothetical protein
VTMSGGIQHNSAAYRTYHDGALRICHNVATWMEKVDVMLVEDLI